jgi:hypothetical protein
MEYQVSITASQLQPAMSYLTENRLMALSLGIAFAVEEHLQRSKSLTHTPYNAAEGPIPSKKNYSFNYCRKYTKKMHKTDNKTSWSMIIATPTSRG